MYVRHHRTFPPPKRRCLLCSWRRGGRRKQAPISSRPFQISLLVLTDLSPEFPIGFAKFCQILISANRAFSMSYRRKNLENALSYFLQPQPFTKQSQRKRNYIAAPGSRLQIVRASAAAIVKTMSNSRFLFLGHAWVAPLSIDLRHITLWTAIGSKSLKNLCQLARRNQAARRPLQ